MALSTSNMINSDETWIEISLAEQCLSLKQGDELLKQYLVSTASNGAGEQLGSECTPRGWHKIRAKIGDGQPVNAVFVGRRSTGEVYSAALDMKYPGRDWILTRILWLSGLEQGKNRLGRVDTMRRYIYMHGTPDKFDLGKPESHGCVRMNNRDIIELFDNVAVGIKVFIHE